MGIFPKALHTFFVSKIIADPFQTPGKLIPAVCIPKTKQPMLTVFPSWATIRLFFDPGWLFVVTFFEALGTHRDILAVPDRYSPGMADWSMGLNT